MKLFIFSGNLMKYLPIPSKFTMTGKNLLWLLAITPFLLHGNVYAKCSAPIYNAIILTTDSGFTIPSNPPAGTVLGSWSYSTSNSTTLTCSPADQVISNVGVRSSASPVATYVEAGQTYGVYPTTVPGLGFVYAAQAVTSAGSSAWIPINVPNNYVIYNGTATSIQNVFKVRLVTTAPLKPGTYGLNLQTAFADSVVYSPTGTGAESQPLWLFYGGSSLVVPGPPTCSLSIDSATFNMGALKTTDFNKGAGSTYNWVSDQSMVASSSCGASTASMTFAGTADTAYPNAFKNNGTAKGVALELWKSGSPQAIPNSSTPITFPAGPNQDFTFSARYIQTEPTVTAGSVSATVTVTVNYQ